MADVLRLEGETEGFGFELPDGSRYALPYPNHLPLPFAVRLSKMQGDGVSDASALEFLVALLDAFCPEAVDKLDVGMATQLFTAWGESSRPALGES